MYSMFIIRSCQSIAYFRGESYASHQAFSNDLILAYHDKGSTYDGKRLMMGDTAYILHPEYCDLCKSQGLQVQAVYDGKTIHGPWAYMCEEHFGVMGVGLGTGRGQRLIVGTKPDKAESSSHAITEVYDEDESDETIANSVDGTLSNASQESETTVSQEGKSSIQEPDVESDVEEEGSSNGIPQPKKLDWGNLYP